MISKGNSKIKKVLGLNRVQYKNIESFCLGLIYAANVLTGKEFSARDLMGGINSNWQHTPLNFIYVKNYNKYKNHNKAYSLSAKEFGMIFKKVIKKCSLNFETEVNYNYKKIRKYKRV